MAYRFPNDIASLVRERMILGGHASEDDVLRDALRALSEEDEDLAAIRAGLAELDAGDPGMPLDDAFREIRAEFQIPDEA